MAAPPEKTMKNLTGKWNVNYVHSDSAEPGLTIQGISYLVRKGILASTITIEVNQYEAAPAAPNEDKPDCWHIDIVQSASGLTSTQENRSIDDTFRPHSDWLFGNIKGHSTWVGVDDIKDEYLKKGWLAEGDKELLLSHVESDDYGWVADQIWGFQEVDGERHYCRNIVITKEAERAEFRFVYDYEE